MRKSRSKRNYAAAWVRDGGVCRYCGRPAECIDHVMPWSLTQDDSLDNIVAACVKCNALAGAKLFPSFEAKRAWLLTVTAPVPGEVCDASGWCEAHGVCWRGSQWRSKARSCTGWGDRTFEPPRPARRASRGHWDEAGLVYRACFGLACKICQPK